MARRKYEYGAARHLESDRSSRGELINFVSKIAMSRFWCGAERAPQPAHCWSRTCGNIGIMTNEPRCWRIGSVSLALDDMPLRAMPIHRFAPTFLRFAWTRISLK